jgi:hypothetical protein
VCEVKGANVHVRFRAGPLEQRLRSLLLTTWRAKRDDRS